MASGLSGPAIARKGALLLRRRAATLRGVAIEEWRRALSNSNGRFSRGGCPIPALGRLASFRCPHLAWRGRMGRAWFTLKQALLSAFLSVFFALPLACFGTDAVWGRQFVIVVLGAPFILPFVAILGLIAVFGQNGIFNLLWTAVGFDRISIYGLQGVLLTCFFQPTSGDTDACVGLDIHSSEHKIGAKPGVNRKGGFGVWNSQCWCRWCPLRSRLFL